jgi:UDP-2,3-diacylglucosamine pyrophosphatase LpxH
MLAVISDLHLTDGSSGEIISESAFRLFKNRLSDMAYDASWRDDKTYVPIKSFDIILLGDILDMIRSEHFNGKPEFEMPWADVPRGPDFYHTVKKVVDGILKFNAKSLKILQGISQGDVTIPEFMEIADEATKEKEKIKYKASGKVRLPINIYYMIGNHDWFFCLPGKEMNDIRNTVIDALGLANLKDTPFPHRRDEYKPLLDTQDAHRVFAEHGDKFDPTNYRGKRDESSVGDVVVVKLLNAIPQRVEHFLTTTEGMDTGNEDLILFIKKLREIDNLRPYGLAPAWITEAIKQTKLEDKLVNRALGEALKLSVLEFLENKMVNTSWRTKLYIFFAKKKFLSHDFNVVLLSKLLKDSSFTRNQLESYKQFAVQQAKDQPKDFFLMGHTHYAELVPICNYIEDKKQRSKIYMNTGTWRQVHLLGDNGTDFISFKSMTIASFYKGDERKGRSFEFWVGSLSL